MGGPTRTPGEAVESLTEAVEIIRAMWRGQRSVRYEGDHYQVHGARPDPLPAHDIGIWLGVTGPRLLRLTGQRADGWVPSMSYMPPARAARGHVIIDEAARDAGRDPAEIRRIYNIGGNFTQNAEHSGSDMDQQINGPVEHWVSRLNHLATEHGFSSFVLWTQPDPKALRLYIEEVAPAVRERVAAQRLERAR